MLESIQHFWWVMFSGDVWESINRFLEHAHNGQNNRGAISGGGVDGNLGWKWCAIHKEGAVQGKCLTWSFVYFHIVWVVHTGGVWGHGGCHVRPGTERRSRGVQGTHKLPL